MKGEILKNFRAEKGLTQSELAERLKCSQDTVSKIESGKRGFPDRHNKVMFWCNVLGVQPKALQPDIYRDSAA